MTKNHLGVNFCNHRWSGWHTGCFTLGKKKSNSTMPTSTTFKDRLRMFEPQAETTQTSGKSELPKQKFGAKGSSVATQYTQNVQRESPRWKPVYPKKQERKNLIDCREEAEEPRSEPAAEQRCEGTETRNESEDKREPLFESPRNARAAYEALIRQNNQRKLSPLEKRSSPGPSTVKSSPVKQQEAGTKSPGFPKASSPPGFRKFIPTAQSKEKKRETASQEKATLLPEKQPPSANGQEEHCENENESFQMNRSPTTPVKFGKFSSQKKCLPAPNLKPIASVGLRRTGNISKNAGVVTTPTDQEDTTPPYKESEKKTEEVASGKLSSLPSPRFSVSPRQHRWKSSIEEKSPRRPMQKMTALKGENGTWYNKSPAKSRTTQVSPSPQSKKDHDHKTFSPVSASTSEEHRLEERHPLSGASSSPVMFPLFPSGKGKLRAGVMKPTENQVLHQSQGESSDSIIPRRSRSRSPMVQRIAAKKGQPVQSPEQSLLNSSANEDHSLQISHKSDDSEKILKSKSSADGSTASKRSRARLLDVRARSPALYKAFTLEMKRSLEVPSSGAEEKKPTCSPSSMSTKSSLTNEELGNIAHQAAQLSKPSPQPTIDNNPLSQMKAYKMTLISGGFDTNRANSKVRLSQILG